MAGQVPSKQVRGQADSKAQENRFQLRLTGHEPADRALQNWLKNMLPKKRNQWLRAAAINYMALEKGLIGCADIMPNADQSGPADTSHKGASGARPAGASAPSARATTKDRHAPAVTNPEPATARQQAARVQNDRARDHGHQCDEAAAAKSSHPSKRDQPENTCDTSDTSDTGRDHTRNPQNKAQAKTTGSSAAGVAAAAATRASDACVIDNETHDAAPDESTIQRGSLSHLAGMFGSAD